MSEDLILGFMAGVLVCAALCSILWGYWLKEALLEQEAAAEQARPAAPGAAHCYERNGSA